VSTYTGALDGDDIEARRRIDHAEAADRAWMREAGWRARATTLLRSDVPLGITAGRRGHSVETLVSTYVGAFQGDDTAICGC
jgi:hypothetical protein